MNELANPFCTRFTRPGAIRYRVTAARHPLPRINRLNEGGPLPECPASEDFTRALLEMLAVARRGLIIGPHGTGKSTLLQTLMPALQVRFPTVVGVDLHAPFTSGWPLSRCRAWLEQTQRVLASLHRLPCGGLLVVDGLEQLGSAGIYWLRWRLRQGNRYLLATSHRPVIGLQELWRTELTPQLVISLTETLLANTDRVIADAVRSAVDERGPEHVENLRDLWFDLYDVAQNATAL